MNKSTIWTATAVAVVGLGIPASAALLPAPSTNSVPSNSAPSNTVDDISGDDV